MFWILSLSAVINITLGYALAVYLAGGSTRCATIEVCAESQQNLPSAASSPPDEQVLGALKEIRSEAGVYHERLTTSDQKLREGAANADEFNAILKDLLGAADDYTRQRDTARAVVAQLQEQSPSLQTPLRNLNAVIDHENSQIATAKELASGLAAGSNTTDQSEAWLGIVEGLLDAGSAVRQQIDDTLETCGVFPSNASTQLALPATDRDAAETRIQRWWDANPERVRPLSVALVDIDRLGELNQTYGMQTMDRAISALTRWLADERPKDGAEGFVGERYLLLFPDQGLRDVFEPVERVRQSIDHMQFRYGDEAIRLTACCAVTEASTADSPATLLASVEATLAEAKRAGRNRTFVHEDGIASPLIPIEMTVETRQLLI